MLRWLKCYGSTENCIIIRLGTFHTICNFLSIIGKRFQDAELRDICLESGIVAEGSLAAVMEGRHYNRAIRVHKYIYEAFMRLIWRGFLGWIEEHHPDNGNHLEQYHELVSDLHDAICQETFDKMLSLPACKATMIMFEDYVQITSKNPFGKIPVDQATEETVNK